MAQLGSTNVYGDLSVTGNISEGGTLLSNKYLGISAKAASASSADTAGSAGYADSAGSANSVAWASVSGKPSFATVATSGAYGDLSGTPSSLPASDVSDWAKAENKPDYNFNEIGAGDITIGDGSNELYFRTNDTYRSGMYYSTPGNEALIFGNKYSVTSWIFANVDPNSRIDWNATGENAFPTPAMQIKNNKVVINKLIANNENADYNLDVNGTVNATTIYENGTTLANTYQAKGSYAPASHSHDYAGLASGESAGGKAASAAYADSAGSASASDVYPWAKASSPPTYTAAEVGAAASDHTHTLSLDTDSGTSTVDLTANTKYKITAGGNSVIFKTPADNNTVTTIASTTGSGNAVTDITANNGALTVTKGSTFLTSHQSVVNGGNTASWGSSCTVGTVGGTALTFTMPANPNTDSNVYCNATSSNNYDYPILMKHSNATTSARGEARFKAGVTINGSTGQLTAPSFMATSALESKENISDATLDAVKLINDTNIVNFTFKDDETHTPKIGFIADYTDSLLATPKHDTMDLYNCIGVLMKASQQMSSRIEALEKRVSELENKK